MEEARSHTVHGDVNHEYESGRLGQSLLATVVFGGHELVGATAEFGAFVHVDAATHVIQMIEVFLRHLSGVITEWAREFFAFTFFQTKLFREFT